jgi:undecaprenyl-phosphate 4-deoxy-4-formamido-L-arabinose transferase
MDVSVVVPVYNSASSLTTLFARLQPVLHEIADKYELILVNDGSIDESGECISRLERDHTWVRGIELMRNYGQHNAILCGIRAARFEILVTMDDDLQHPPEEIPKLLAMFGPDCDAVYGSPESEQHSFWRNVTSRMTKRVLRAAMGVPTASEASAFRAFRTQLRDAFASYASPFVSIDVLLSWGTVRFKAVKVRHAPRAHGVSHYSLRKLVVHAINMLTGFTTWPLRIASLVGFGFTLFGIVVFVYVIGRFVLEGGSVPGFPFLASIIAIFSGAQLFALGIMGEYLARMHFRSIERPPYCVRLDDGGPPEEPRTGSLGHAR